MYATTATYRPEEMEGRSYGSDSSSFLSVDAYVQDPSNAQGFNRYAYCAYNPLRYTDPSGWLYLGASRSQESEFNRYRRYANASMTEEQWANRGIDRVILATIRLGVGLEMTPFMMGEVRKGGGGAESQTGPSQAMQQVAGGEWIFLKGKENFKVLLQSDSWQKDPNMCKYTSLAMVEYYLLGDFARTSEELKTIAEENGWDKKDLLYLYEKLSAEYVVRDSNPYSSDIERAMKYGCPIIFSAEKINSEGHCVYGHAAVITGINREGINKFELELADPLYSNPGGNPFNYITSDVIHKLTITNNIFYEIIRFEPYIK